MVTLRAIASQGTQRFDRKQNRDGGASGSASERATGTRRPATKCSELSQSCPLHCERVVTTHAPGVRES
jgi:hypothetical protein